MSHPYIHVLLHLLGPGSKRSDGPEARALEGARSGTSGHAAAQHHPLSAPAAKTRVRNAHYGTFSTSFDMRTYSNSTICNSKSNVPYTHTTSLSNGPDVLCHMYSCSDDPFENGPNPEGLLHVSNAHLRDIWLKEVWTAPTPRTRRCPNAAPAAMPLPTEAREGSSGLVGDACARQLDGGDDDRRPPCCPQCSGKQKIPAMALQATGHEQTGVGGTQSMVLSAAITCLRYHQAVRA